MDPAAADSRNRTANRCAAGKGGCLMAKENGYVGRISNSGAQKAEAPHALVKKGKPVVKKDGDLRTRKSK